MITRFFRVLHILSIDIVIGAVILLHFFSGILQVNVPWVLYVLLASAVWLVYTLDHLRDAGRAQAPLRDRYAFHLRHKVVLKWLLMAVGIISCMLVWLLEINMWVAGGCIALLSIGFILFQSTLSRFHIKELYVALVYTLGVVLAPFLLAGQFSIVIFLNLLFLSVTNLLLFSWYEEEEDAKDDFLSIATSLGSQKVQFLLMAFISVGVAFSVLSISIDWRYSYFLIAFLAYLGLVQKKDFFRVNDRYRFIGDGIFLLPVFFQV